MSGRLGSLLDAHECCVDFEHVRKVLAAHRSEVVAANTENNGKLALMGADAKCASMMHVSTLERLGCCIRADQTGNHDSRGNA